jgi:glyoxylase-like metal-dependent hydrolase (beta-lactamase superfamily II)
MIHPISIPVKLPIKKTNCTIVFSDPLTVIDPGVKSESTLNIIRNALRQNGKTLKDIKKILITHGHIDHFGAAPALREISGAEIYIHPHDAYKAARFHRKDDAYTLAYKNILTLHGSPHTGLRGIDLFWDYIKDMYDPLTDTAFYETPRIAFEDLTLEIIETPGHTRGSVVFYERDQKLMISGDTLINGITPNPVIEFLDNGSRFESKAHFKESLAKLSKLPVRRVIAGHGEDITGFEALCAKYENDWAKKEKSLTRLFKEKQVLSAYEALLQVFGPLEEFNIFLGMSEIIGSLDYLAGKNIVEYFEEKGKIKARYCGENR